MSPHETVAELYQGLSEHEKMLVHQICEPKRRRSSLKDRLISNLSRKSLVAFESLHGLSFKRDESTHKERRNSSCLLVSAHEESGLKSSSTPSTFCGYSFGHDETDLGEYGDKCQVLIKASISSAENDGESLPAMLIKKPFFILPLQDDYFDCEDAEAFVSSNNKTLVTCTRQDGVPMPQEVIEFDKQSFYKSRRSSLGICSLSAKSFRLKQLLADRWVVKHSLRTLSNEVSRNATHNLKSMRKLIYAICSDDNGIAKDSVCMLDGVKTVCSCIRDFHDPRVLEMAVRILGCLANGCYDRQELLSQQNAVAQILSCMKRFSPTTEKLLHEECVIALYNLSNHPENSIQIGYNYGVPILLKAMVGLKTNLSIQKHAFRILLRLAQIHHLYVASKPHLFTVLNDVMNKHAHSLQLQMIGVILLRHLASVSVEDEGVIDNMICSEIVQCLIDSMQEHSANRSIVCHGFATCNLICRSSDGNSRIKAQEILANTRNFISLIQMILYHEKEVCIQREAFKALRSLRSLPSSYFGQVPDSVLTDGDFRNVLYRAGLSGKIHRSATRVSLTVSLTRLKERRLSNDIIA